MLKAHKHWALELTGEGYFRLGAGRSQVQILSPRLEEKQVIEPKVRRLALSGKKLHGEQPGNNFSDNLQENGDHLAH